MVALQGQQLSAIYMQYAIYEDILVALSLFYGRVRGQVVDLNLFTQTWARVKTCRPKNTLL